MAAPVLKAQHLGIQFGGLKAVDDFNMEIGESELVGLIGPNGAGKVVITGLDRGSMIANVICEKGHKPKIIRQKRCGHERSGTGDVFASIIAASAVLGYDFELSVRKASHFVRDCIAATEAMDIPPTDGVCFEEVLHTLK